MDPEWAAEQAGREGGRSHPDNEIQAGWRMGGKGGAVEGVGGDWPRYTTTVNSRPSPNGSSMET
jgi:hypothetical protein